MKLYHYTCLDHLRQILQDNELKTTASNLLQPVAPRIVNGTLADVTDNVKPVVWFTTIDDFSKVTGCGLNGGNMDKTEAVIVVDTAGPRMFYKWDDWAKKNGIDGTWFAGLKRTAPQWETFYVSEQSIPIDNNVSIGFRPDVMADLKKGGR